jgi:hypothetical protein
MMSVALVIFEPSQSTPFVHRLSAFGEIDQCCACHLRNRSENWSFCLKRPMITFFVDEY